MKLTKIALALVLVVAPIALAQVTINEAPSVTLSCTSGGGTAQTVNGGSYLFTVTGDTYLCRADSAATCASGGVFFPAGSVLLLTVQGVGSKVALAGSRSPGSKGKS